MTGTSLVPFPYPYVEKSAEAAVIKAEHWAPLSCANCEACTDDQQRLGHRANERSIRSASELEGQGAVKRFSALGSRLVIWKLDNVGLSRKSRESRVAIGRGCLVCGHCRAVLTVPRGAAGWCVPQGVTIEQAVRVRWYLSTAILANNLALIRQ